MTQESAEREVVERGQAAWKELKSGVKQTWENWVEVGRALEQGRVECGGVGLNNRRGRGFNQAFSKWLKERGMGDIDAGTRSRLECCMQNREAIEQWRGTLNLAELMATNHPNSVWRKYEAHVNKGTRAKKATSPMVELKQKLAQTQKELDRIKRNGGERFTANDMPMDVAKVLVSMFSEPKLKNIVKALTELEVLTKEDVTRYAAEARQKHAL